MPALRTERLANGLAVSIVERHELPLIAVSLAVPTLTSLDAGAPPGLTAFTSEVLLRELARATEDDRERELLPPRVESGADGLIILLRAPSRALDRVLAVLAALLAGTACDHADAETARAVLAQEAIAARAPGGRAREHLTAVLYGPHDPRSLPRYGSESSVAELTTAHCQWARTRALVPELASLFIVGDVDSEGAITRASAALSGWQRPLGSILVPPPPTFPAATQHVFLFGADSEQAGVYAIEGGPPPDHPDFAPFALVSRLLGGIFGARLNLELRERRGWAYGLSAEHEVFRDHSMVVLGCITRQEHAIATTQLVFDELARLSDASQIGELELETARAVERATLLASVDTATGLAEVLARAALMQRDLAAIEAYDAALLRASARDVARVAATWLRPTALPIAVIANPRAVARDLAAAFPGRAAVVR